MRHPAFLLVLLLALTASLPWSGSAEAEDVIIEVVDPGQPSNEARTLGLYWSDGTGKPIRSLPHLADLLESRGRRLVFGMNAGMYHSDGSPVGLLVIDGVQQAPLNLADGDGNFHLKPNGVLLMSHDGPAVVDAAQYTRYVNEGDPPAEGANGHDSRKVRWATQSGPLLLKDGRMHPGLSATSPSRHIRNGACVRDGHIVLAISTRRMNLHEFARVFRDRIGCADALYLDGVVSSLYAPSRGRFDARDDLGPLIAVTEASH